MYVHVCTCTLCYVMYMYIHVHNEHDIVYVAVADITQPCGAILSVKFYKNRPYYFPSPITTSMLGQVRLLLSVTMYIHVMQLLSLVLAGSC